MACAESRWAATWVVRIVEPDAQSRTIVKDDGSDCTQLQRLNTRIWLSAYSRRRKTERNWMPWSVWVSGMMKKAVPHGGQEQECGRFPTQGAIASCCELFTIRQDGIVLEDVSAVEVCRGEGGWYLQIEIQVQVCVVKVTGRAELRPEGGITSASRYQRTTTHRTRSIWNPDHSQTTTHTRLRYSP